MASQVVASSLNRSNSEFLCRICSVSLVLYFLYSVKFLTMRFQTQLLWGTRECYLKAIIISKTFVMLVAGVQS